MDNYLRNWKKRGLHSFFMLMLIGIVAGLSACGGGGGSTGTVDKDNGFGVLTISGADTPALGSTYNPTAVVADANEGFTWTLIPGDPSSKAVENGDKVELTIRFLTAIEPLGAIEKVVLTYTKGKETKSYLCDPLENPINGTPCKGSIVLDKGANTVIFSNLEVAVNTNPAILNNTATEPIIFNGTLKTKADNTGDPKNSEVINFSGGSVTISGNDIGAGEGGLTLSLFSGGPPPEKLFFRMWFTSSNSSIVVAFINGGISSVTVGVGSTENRRIYGCNTLPAGSACKGLTHDSAAKTLTFNNVVLEPSTVPNTFATATVTVSGTVKYPK